LGIKAEERLIGRGVSYCGTCDGPLFKGKEIAVVGGGDRALEEAVYLSGYAAKVTLIHRRPEFRASEVLAEKAKINPKVNFILESVVEEILGETKVEGLKIKNLKTNQMLELSCAGVFIFAGIKPNTNFLQDFLNLDKEGFVITDGEMQTSRLGVFACGDCRRKSLYQVITACSDGAVAAASAHKYLLKQ
jgi:thioredoxin reductase (NADPH)